MAQELCHNRQIGLPPGGQGATLIASKAKACLHQIVQGGIGGPGIKGHQRPHGLRHGPRGICPCDIAHPAKVQKRHRRLGQMQSHRPARQRKMEKRHQGCTLSAGGHIRTAHIPGHWHPKADCQPRPRSSLMSAACARIMRQSLAVKACNRGHWRQICHHLGMGDFNNAGGLSHACLGWPAAKGCTDHRALLRVIGTIGGGAKLLHFHAIGQHQRGIHPVHRGARHRSQRPDRAIVPIRHRNPSALPTIPL